MSDRIKTCFAKAKAEGRGAFVAYLTMGYPTLEQSEAAADALVAGGADIIELGVPFSDPFADGAVIRAAAYEALKQGVTLDDVLALAGRLRAKHPDTAFVLFTYYNLVFSKGLETFAAAAAKADIDAVLSSQLLKLAGEAPILRDLEHFGDPPHRFGCFSGLFNTKAELTEGRLTQRLFPLQRGG